MSIDIDILKKEMTVDLLPICSESHKSEFEFVCNREKNLIQYL